MNLLTKSYDAFDGMIMKGATAAVHAWNWTTGRNKSDLANLLQSASAVSFSSGNLYYSPALIPLVIFHLRITHSTQKIYTDTEFREEKASLSGAKDIEAERMKKFTKFPLTPLLSTTGGAIVYKGISQED
jgi:hypothetical protein